MVGEVEKAAQYFSRGLYCSQAVFGAFCAKYGLIEEVAFRLSCGLNSGVRCAEVCGAVTGAVLVIGLKFGDVVEVCNFKTREFVNTFTGRYGSVVCRDILNCDIFTDAGREVALRENLFATRCLEVVVHAAQILVDLGC